MKQDGCRKFANEDEAPSTPVEKKVKRNDEEYKKRLGCERFSMTITQKVNFIC